MKADRRWMRQCAQGRRPNISEGDKSLNWYYALNNFQYRLVGHKQGDRITYQVEVQAV